MTYKIITYNTNKFISFSNVRPDDDPINPNLCLDMFDRYRSDVDVTKSERDVNHGQHSMMVMKPEYIISRNFLTDPLDDEWWQRSSIVKSIT